MSITPTYGISRSKRADVSFAEIERAANDILKVGTRPTVEALRSALGGGSPRTLLDGLNRYWRDLGTKLSGAADTRRDLPAAVADLANTLWQQALTLAAEASISTDSAEAAKLAARRTDTEVREHAVSLREIDLDQHLRSRERTVRELEEHLRATMSLVSKRDATIASLQSRLDAALTETDDYRQRLAAVVTRAVSRHTASAKTKQPTKRVTRKVTLKPVRLLPRRSPPRVQAVTIKSRSRKGARARGKRHRSYP